MPYRKIYLLLFNLCTTSIIYAQLPTGPEIAWQRCYGTSGRDYFTDAITTTDGGFAAYAVYGAADGDFLDSLQAYGRLMKFDSSMNIVWQKSVANLVFEQILEVSDGYVLAGATLADTGIASGNHGLADILLVKTDLNGNFQWSKCYGSPGDESFNTIVKLYDGYLITGNSNSSGGDIPIHYGSSFSSDGIIYALDLNGDINWIKVLGGTEGDGATAIKILDTNNFIVAVGSYSEDYDLAESGIIGGKFWFSQWQIDGTFVYENFIPSQSDIYSVLKFFQFYSGNIYFTGLSNPNSILFPSQAGHDAFDIGIGCLNTSFELTNLFQFGGSKNDLVSDIAFDYNNKVFISGHSFSSDFDLPGNYNNNEKSDYWLFAIDTLFNLLWSKNFGGSSPQGEYTFTAGSIGSILYKDNYLYYFGQCQVPDLLPDYDIACGHINPDLDDDTDAWLIAFDLSTVNIDTPTVQANFSIYPNPVENVVHILNNTTDSNVYTIAIFNMLGQKLLVPALLKHGDNTINMQSQPSGFYMAAILRDGIIIQTEKILLQ